jgi:ubiquitin C-terminal hydrolase
MQRAIDDTKSIQSKCHTCGKSAITSVTYGKHVIIDTSVFTDRTYITSDIKHKLYSIAKTIALNNINYILSGVVHYKQNTNNNGHYTALTYAGTHWYEYDDLKKNAIR